MAPQKLSGYAITGVATLIAASYLVVFLTPDQLHWLTLEDGLVENLGSLFFFVTAVLLFMAWRQSNSFPTRLGSLGTRRNTIYLGMSLLFVFAAGEEISWGQRLFGWSTPDGLVEINEQNETNLHNLTPFQGEEAAIDLHTLYSLFWLGLCVGVPVLALNSSLRTRLLNCGFPVTALWVGGLFLLNYLIFKTVGRGLSPDGRHGLNELKETNSALAFVFFALLEWRRVSAQAEPQGARIEPRGQSELAT